MGGSRAAGRQFPNKDDEETRKSRFSGYSAVHYRVRLKSLLPYEREQGIRNSKLPATPPRSERPVPHTYQVRPEFPENNDAGKPLKYEFVSNVGTPLELHPAILTDRIDTTPVPIGDN
jgi:hypothetical protein